MSNGAPDAARQRWQQRYDDALARGQVRDADFTTLSGVEVDPVYGCPFGEPEECELETP